MVQTISRTLTSIQDKFNFKVKPLRLNTTNLTSLFQKNETTQRTILNSKFFLSSTAVATAASATPNVIIEPIPEPPPVPLEAPEAAAEVVSQINALGEATFASLGLGGKTPVGLVQTCFEYLHVTLGIPWWEAVVIGTLVIRFCMFPLVVVAQRNAAKMNNYMPQLQMLQLKMTEARQTGNQLEAARYSQEMMLFMKEKKLNPLKNMIVPLAQV